MSADNPEITDTKVVTAIIDNSSPLHISDWGEKC